MTKPKNYPENDDFYKLLEVDRRARAEVIRAAYRALSIIYHPDKGGDGRKAARLNEAYATLSDPKKRASYDDHAQTDLGKTVGNYHVLEYIREGSFGKTYKGKSVILKEPVCIKHCSRISPQDDEVLIEETRAMWDLRHYAIPAVRDLLRLEDGSMALIMSYIPGLTLESIIEKKGRLEAEHVVWITERILNALMYIHYHGIIHGDIKPQNVIIQPESHTVVLVDFGLSMIKPSARSDNKGYTPYFASPEQIKGSTLLPESDFYSLGMLMVYALGGLDSVRKKEVPVETPDLICDFIRRLMVRDVLSRPKWDKEDLTETIRNIRKKVFGRSHSGMKPISGI